MKKKLLGLAALCMSLAFSNAAHAAIQLNEIFINPPGTDGGLEFIEFKSTTGGVESLSGLTLLILEGDGSSLGSVDAVLNLGSFSTGTNGLFLWRDAATVLSPAPNANTTLNVADFNPDIENGSNTYLIVSGFTGALNADLDTDNNGVLDVTPWTSVVDAIGFLENDTGANVSYSGSLGFANFAANAGFNPDALVRMTDGSWISMDVSGSGNGPFNFDNGLTGPGNRTQDISGAALDTSLLDINYLTPGDINPSVVPEPSTLALGAMGLIGLVGYGLRRGRKS